MKWRQGWWTLAAVTCIGLWCACGSDTRLAGKKLRSPSVRTVTHYGITLDSAATPQQVAYVALRAIRDDVLAKTKADREAALDKQFDVCAAGAIAARNKSSLPRDQYVHRIVYHWAPTVAHYVGDFPLDWEAAARRMSLEVEAAAKEAKGDKPDSAVVMALADPSGDPNAAVILRAWLTQDAGYWRVTHLGFDPTRRSLATASTAGAGLPPAASAPPSAP